MFDSLFLSLFAFIFFLFSIYTFEKVNFQFLEKGKQFNLSRLCLIFIISAVILVVTIATWILLNQASEIILQYFYPSIFTVSFFFSCLLFLPKTKFWAFLDFLMTFIFLGVIFKFHFQILENIFLAFANLWVAPVVLKKLNIKTKYLLIFIIFFLLYDIINIYFIKPDFTVFDSFILGGSIVFGGSLLGIGDFFLAYLVINAARKDISKKIAVMLAFFIAFASLFIYFLSPDYSGNFPYSMIITPAVLIVYVINQIFKRIKTTA